MESRNDSFKSQPDSTQGLEPSIALHLESTSSGWTADPNVEVVANGRRQWAPHVEGETALRLKLDDVSQELLQARDALIGAECEGGVLRAKLTELEAQLQARDREIGELSAKLSKLTTQPSSAGASFYKIEAALQSAARQAKMVAKRRVHDR